MVKISKFLNEKRPWEIRLYVFDNQEIVVDDVVNRMNIFICYFILNLFAENSTFFCIASFLSF